MKDQARRNKADITTLKFKWVSMRVCFRTRVVLPWVQYFTCTINLVLIPAVHLVLCAQGSLLVEVRARSKSWAHWVCPKTKMRTNSISLLLNSWFQYYCYLYLKLDTVISPVLLTFLYETIPASKKKCTVDIRHCLIHCRSWCFLLLIRQLCSLSSEKEGEML